MTQSRGGFWADGVDIRIHGRGGQGALTLTALIVDSAFRSGWHALGFPSFGTERTGAPVAGFVRLARKPVFDRSEVRMPGVVLVQDPTLAGTEDVGAGLAPGGLILLNAEDIPGGLLALPAIALPVTKFAIANLGAAKTSTAMLGFFAAATGIVSVEAACAAIRERLPGEAGERNVAVALAAYRAAGGGRAVA